MSGLTAISESNFSSVVLESKGPVLVDFWAQWCGPCKALTPVLEEIASAMGQKASLVKVDIDENSNLAAQYGIRSVPTMIIFKDGNIVRNLVGAQPKNEIMKVLNELADQ